jgi:hypothetical protein
MKWNYGKRTDIEGEKWLLLDLTAFLDLNLFDVLVNVCRMLEYSMVFVNQLIFLKIFKIAIFTNTNKTITPEIHSNIKKPLKSPLINSTTADQKPHQIHFNLA